MKLTQLYDGVAPKFLRTKYELTKTPVAPGDKK